MANGTTPSTKISKDDEMLLQGVRGALYGALTTMVWNIFNIRWTGGARAFLDRYFRTLFKRALRFFILHLSRNPLLVVAMAELIVDTMSKIFKKIVEEKKAKGETIEASVEVLEKEIEHEMPTYALEVAHEVIEEEQKGQPVVETTGSTTPPMIESTAVEVPNEAPPATVETPTDPTPTPVVETPAPAPVIESTPVVTPMSVAKEEPKPLFDGLTQGESAMLAVMYRKMQSGVKLSDHDQRIFEILYNTVLTHGDPDANPKSVRDQIIEAFMPTQLAQAGEAIRNKIVEAKKEEAAAMANLSNVLSGNVTAPAAAIPVSTVPEEMVVIGNGVPTSTPATPVAAPVVAPVTPTPTPAPTPVNNTPAQPANSTTAAPAATIDNNKRSWLARATDLLKTVNDKLDAKRVVK